MLPVYLLSSILFFLSFMIVALLSIVHRRASTFMYLKRLIDPFFRIIKFHLYFPHIYLTLFLHPVYTSSITLNYT